MKRRIAGILLIVLSVGALGFWEIWGRENLSYQKIAEQTVTERKLLKTRIADKAGKTTSAEIRSTKGAITWDKAGDIVGLETKQFVAGELELHREYFREPEFKVGKEFDRYILMIPDT